jgi:hypothetical protein
MEYGNGDSSSDANLESSKTSTVEVLDLEIPIFVKIFEYYLVTQALQKPILKNFSNNCQSQNWKERDRGEE